MKKLLSLIIPIVALSFMGCAGTHFGVRDKALILPADVAKTEEAITKAEKSEGAKYCPEKIAKAKAIAKDAMDIYWACQTQKAMDMLAEARKMAQEAESCRPPAPPVVAVPSPVPMAANQPVSFHTVYFDFDKSNLKPEAIAELDRAIKIMVENPQVVLELQGNTDSIGSIEYNRALGQKRADSVFNYLKSKGIAPNRMKEVSFGEEKPATTNKTRSGRALNRRVDFVRLDIVITK